MKNFHGSKCNFSRTEWRWLFFLFLYYPWQVAIERKNTPRIRSNFGIVAQALQAQWNPSKPCSPPVLSSQADTPAMSPVHPHGRTGHKLEEEAHTSSGNTPHPSSHAQGDFPDSWSVAEMRLKTSCTYSNYEKSHKIPENLMILQCWKQFKFILGVLTIHWNNKELNQMIKYHLQLLRKV